MSGRRGSVYTCPNPSWTMAYTLAATMMTQITAPIPIIIFPLEKSTGFPTARSTSLAVSVMVSVTVATTISSLTDSSFEACSLAEAVSDVVVVDAGSTASYTVITCFDEVSRMRGKVTNGSTIESTTWDATRSVAIPGRPTAMATIRDGIRPKQRVIRRVRTGCTSTNRRISYGPRGELLEWRTYRSGPVDEALGHNLRREGRDNRRALASGEKRQCEQRRGSCSGSME